MPTTVSERVRKRRQAMRAAGLRPVQIWLADNRAPGFAAECRRQAIEVANANRKDADPQNFLDAAAADTAADPECCAATL